MLVWTYDEFYSCSTLNDGMLGIFVIDWYRFVTTALLAFFLYMPDAVITGVGAKFNWKLLYHALFVGSLVALFFHLVQLADSHSSTHCPMRELDDANWKNELLKVFPDYTCTLESAGQVSIFETMSNPHVLEHARNWCSDRIQMRCYNHKDSASDIMHCLRNGATDFVYHLKYIYVFDLIGDASRCLAFLSLAGTAMHSKGLGFGLGHTSTTTTKLQKFRL